MRFFILMTLLPAVAGVIIAACGIELTKEPMKVVLLLTPVCVVCTYTHHILNRLDKMEKKHDQ